MIKEYEFLDERSFPFFFSTFTCAGLTHVSRRQPKKVVIYINFVQSIADPIEVLFHELIETSIMDTILELEGRETAEKSMKKILKCSTMRPTDILTIESVDMEAHRKLKRRNRIEWS